MRQTQYVVLALLGAMLGSAVHAGPTEYVVQHPLCELPTEILTNPPRSPPFPPSEPHLAVGCPIVDPTLGCAADAPLKLRVQFNGPPGARAQLAFSNISPQALRNVEARGAVNRDRRDPSIFVLNPGVTVITGFAGGQNPAPLVRSSVEVPSEWRKRLSSGVTSARASAALGFNQFIGTVLVSTVVQNHLFVPCPKANIIQDRIKLNDNSSARKTVVLIDGKRADGCKSNEMDFGQAEVPLGNLLQYLGCEGEARATVFSAGNAVQFKPNLTNAWHDAPTDAPTITLDQMAIQPVKLWMLYSSCPSCPTAAHINKMETKLDRARVFYPAQFGGISFRTVDTVDLSQSTNPVVVAARNLDCSSLTGALGIVDPETGETRAPGSLAKLAAVMALPEAAPSDPNETPIGERLDVFFVESAVGDGVWCGETADAIPTPEGANIILLASTYRDFTLTHEIGHALLNWGTHMVAGVDGFGADNLMLAQYFGKHLTIGQLFRMSLEDQSALNRHDARTGAKVTCQPTASSHSCPKASCDVARETDALLAGSIPCAP